MKPEWIIERDVFNTQQFNEMCTHLGNRAHVVRIVPFLHELEGAAPATNSNKVIAYGSIGIQKVAQQQNWTPGVFTGDFAATTYAKQLEDKYLNHDAREYTLSHYQTICNLRKADGLNLVEFEFFCKPNDDDKAFAGQVFKASEFSDWVNKMQDIGYLDSLDFDIVVAPVQELAIEYRVVVVGDKIADMCIYRQWQQVMPERIWDDDVAHFVESCAERFNPADVYVIDVSQTHEGLKVVEYNTFNSAGFYALDVPTVLNAVDAFVEKL